MASATAPASMMAPSTMESGGTGSLPNAATRYPLPAGFSSTALTALDPMSSPTTVFALRNTLGDSRRLRSTVLRSFCSIAVVAAGAHARPEPRPAASRRLTMGNRHATVQLSAEMCSFLRLCDRPPSSGLHRLTGTVAALHMCKASVGPYYPSSAVIGCFRQAHHGDGRWMGVGQPMRSRRPDRHEACNSLCQAA